MPSRPVHVHRARVASLSRSRPADDPELVAARALEKSLPITSRLRNRIIDLFSDVLSAPDGDGDTAANTEVGRLE